MIYVLTGEGKGKTTSAVGMGIRAVGAGKRVLMIQFLKTGTSENKLIGKIDHFDIKTFGREGFFLPKSKLEKNPQFKESGVKPLEDKDLKLAKEGFKLAKESCKEYDLLILDEIFIALKFKLLDKEEVINFLEKNRSNLDIVLTGRDCPEEVIELADLVSEVKEKKHYYKKGVAPRKGIEF